MRAFDFFYDLGSPYCYLASTRLPGLQARTGAQAILHPITLGGVRKELGTLVPPRAQLEYSLADVRRWAQRYGVPFGTPAAFPTRTLQALRACVAAGEEGSGAQAMTALFRAYWVKLKDIADPAVIAAALDESGLDGARLLARSEEPAVKEALRKSTDLALRRGVFGVPMFFAGEHSFWGNDRLDFLEAALRET